MFDQMLSSLRTETLEEKLLWLTISNPTGIARWEIGRVLWISGNRLGELLKQMSESEYKIVARRTESRNVKDVMLTPLGVENLCKAVKQTRTTKIKVHAAITSVQKEKDTHKTFHVMHDICRVNQREWIALLDTHAHLFQRVNPIRMGSSRYLPEGHVKEFLEALKKLRSTIK
jgi:hypothetical protein